MDTAAGAAPQSLPDVAAAPHTRSRLVRDVVVFQVKLLFDGVRDFLFSPLSIAAGLIGLAFGGRDPGLAFRRLLALGRSSDRWINLFGEYPAGRASGTGSVDTMIDDLEDALRRDYAEGGITARSRATVEAGLERLRAEMARRQSCRQG